MRKRPKLSSISSAKGGPMRKGKKNGRRPKRFLQDEQDEILQKNEGKKKTKVQICLLMIVTIVL